MRAKEFLTEALAVVKLGPQLFAPHPKKSGQDFTVVGESFALKPRAGRWTSSARQTADGFTSAWVDWGLTNMPNWVGSEGVLYDVAPGAKVLSMNSDQDAVEAAQQYGVEIKTTMDLFQKMPWQAIAKDYDAVHYNGKNRSGDMYMNTWDVESTAWFNTAALINPRPVKIDRPELKKSQPEPAVKKPRYMTRRRQ